MAELISYILGGTAMTLLSFVIVIMAGPLIGGSIENAVPELSATSEWNASFNPSIKQGSEVWETTIPFLIVAAIVFVAAIIVYIIRWIA
jgi:hypothetical protein